MLDATEMDYNASSRHVEFKLAIFFDGLRNPPVEVTASDYLIRLDILEETSADTDKPFGAISANELTVTLHNDGGRFTPTDSRSPYYGKIKEGVPIRVYSRPVGSAEPYNWLPLGEFYTIDWKAHVTGLTADIVATDKLQRIFDMSSVKLPVVANVSYSNLFMDFFTAIGEDANVDDSLTAVLPFAYKTLPNKEFLNELTTSAQVHTYCDRNGVPTVKYARGRKPTSHTLTDADQIKSIDAYQSATLAYSGVEVIANCPQESDMTSLLTINPLLVNAGTTTSSPTSFSVTPVYKVAAARIGGAFDVSLVDLSATSSDVVYTLRNDHQGPVDCKLEILGTSVETVPIILSDEAPNMLKVDSLYIQTAEYAQSIKRLLNAFVTSDVPVLQLTTRGNPFYLLGEKLRVVSDRFNIDFSGVLIRQTFTYDGALSSTLTLLNSKIMEVA